jgi:2-polyprenyl-3-methyl-5-hydroxy-6-metoxy-1,4-benzoquinol methylase
MSEETIERTYVSTDATELTECIACGSSQLTQVLDLNNQPLANSFLRIEELQFPEPIFPLVLNSCTECSHLQLSHAVNPDLLFKNYLYVSGTSKTLKEYFDWFANFTLQYVENPRTVLDIACNDGTQLDSFKALGLETFGVDPATNLHKLSSVNHNVICDYLKRDHIGQLQVQELDIINAQNVFAHTSDPLEFLSICKNIMHDKTVLFIQTSQADMVKNNEFDTIYHEHLSFFNVNSMQALANRAGLNLIDVLKTHIHGNSYVFVFSKTAEPRESIKNWLHDEREMGLQESSTYVEYAEKAKKVVVDLNETIAEYRSKGFRIVGYGAAAKGNTLLNFGNILLDYIIDDNPLKQGLFAPGVRTPVVSIDALNLIPEETPILFVPLAWNFYTEIQTRIKNVRDNANDVFVKYFPTIVIE